MNKLLEMLKYRRPSYSDVEELFIKQYIDTVRGMQKDSHGNRYMIVGDNPNTMFTAHTDTVHLEEGFQTVYVDDYAKQVFVYDLDTSNCLGADDTTGVWLLIEMIKKKIPGMYIFFRGEESGGIGSDYFAENYFEMLDEIDHCISMDRKGKGSIITHQIGGRCCSDQFANALALQLTGIWKPDSTGSFTDSANLMDIIPECTNLSVGYDKQHTINETQCLDFAQALPNVMAAVDWSNLPVKREPEPMYDAWDDLNRSFYAPNTAAWNAASYYDSSLETRGDVYEFVYRDPHGAADLLWEYLSEERYGSVGTTKTRRK